MFFGLLLSKSTQNKNFTLLCLTVFNLILSKSSNYVEAVYLLNVCALAYQLDIFNLCLIDGVIMICSKCICFILSDGKSFQGPGGQQHDEVGRHKT